MSTTAPTRTTLAITGLTCSACVRGVTAALSRVPGVAKIDVEIGPSSKAAPAVENAGYEARLAVLRNKGA